MSDRKMTAPGQMSDRKMTAPGQLGDRKKRAPRPTDSWPRSMTAQPLAEGRHRNDPKKGQVGYAG